MEKKILIVVFVLAVFTSGVLAEKILFSNNQTMEDELDILETRHKNMLSMMLEQNAGAGDYSLETRSSWPTKEEGYIFNSTLSKCEKGSKLSWDEELNAVVMEGATSDKCYVYFDVYVEFKNFLADWVKSQYTGTQGDNNLYYHNSTLANGAGDNSYRYAGAHDEVNNFVCFGSDEETCPDDNLYRIIGVFENQVKLIKWDYANSDLLGTDGDYYSSTFSASSYSSYKGSKTTINRYYWNSGGTNTWSTSNLNTTNLNTNFINNIGSTWANKIATTTWIVGGNIFTNIAGSGASLAYTSEIKNSATTDKVSNKIGLMYTSDYYYGASSIYWTYVGYDNVSNDSTKDYRATISSNWMYMGLYDWTIVRRSDNTNYVFGVTKDGALDYYKFDVDGYASEVRPVFYLNSDVVKVGNNIGSKSDPIKIS